MFPCRKLKITYNLCLEKSLILSHVISDRKCCRVNYKAYQGPEIAVLVLIGRNTTAWQPYKLHSLIIPTNNKVGSSVRAMIHWSLHYDGAYFNKTPDKALFQQKKLLIFVLFFYKKHMLWYSLEGPHWGTSNEYPQHMVSWKIKKKYFPDTLFSSPERSGWAIVITLCQLSSIVLRQQLVC